MRSKGTPANKHPQGNKGLPRARTPCGPRLGVLSLLALALFAGADALGASLFEQAMDESEQLSGAGAWQLSLAVLDRHRPNYGKSPGLWLRWLRRRVAIQELAGDHAGVIQGLKKLPRDLPARAKMWAIERAAQASLRLGKSGEARRQLSRLFWLTTATTDKRRFAGWRRQVIESYLGEGLVADARTAALRYQLDYGDASRGWRELQARVALRNGDPKQVLETIGKPKNGKEVVLRLTARVHTKDISEKALLAAVQSLLADDKTADGTKRDAWLTVYEYARAQRNPKMAVESLEQALAFELENTLGQGKHADALWVAYQDLAADTANKGGLLIGVFEDWFELARQQKEPSSRARALFAYLLLRAPDMAAGRQGAPEFVHRLEGMPGGMEVMDALFLHAAAFRDRASIPVAARHLLVDRALARGEIGLASDLIGSLESPPSGVANFDWQLRRARVLVLGGQKMTGAAVLRELLKTTKQLPPEQADRFSQVVFDLQSADGHDLAFGLFAQALDKAPSQKYVRETLFWMADSLVSKKMFSQAAQLYLKSAMLPGMNTMDRWALSARYQAAQALAKANLVGDARNVYQSLLDVTQDPSRRAVLTRAMQQLWIKHDRKP